MSISISKILTLGFVIIIAVVIVAGLLTRTYVFDSFKNQQQFDLDLHAENLSKIIEIELLHKTSFVEDFVKHHKLISSFERFSPNDLTLNTIKLRQQNPDLVGLAVFDQHGSVIGDSKSQGIGFQCSRDIRHQIVLGAPFSTPPIHQVDTEQAHFDIPIPFKTEASNYYLLMSFKISIIQDIIQKFAYKNNNYLLKSEKGVSISEIRHSGNNLKTEIKVPRTQWILQVETSSENINEALKYPMMFFIFMFIFLIFSAVIFRKIILFYLNKDLSALNNMVYLIDQDDKINKPKTALRDFDKLQSDIYKQAVDLQESRNQLQQQSITDSLTKIANRHAFDDDIKAFQNLSLRGVPCTMALIDLNNFKQVNDELGHVVGDKLLIMIAQFLTKSIRESDQVYRIGGDEFLVILVNSNIEQSDVWKKTVKINVQNVIKEMAELNKLVKPLGISIGLEICSGKDIKATLKSADESMYADKQLSKSIHKHQS